MEFYTNFQVEIAVAAVCDPEKTCGSIIAHPLKFNSQLKHDLTA